MILIGIAFGNFLRSIITQVKGIHFHQCLLNTIMKNYLPNGDDQDVIWFVFSQDKIMKGPIMRKRARLKGLAPFPT